MQQIVFEFFLMSLHLKDVSCCRCWSVFCTVNKVIMWKAQFSWQSIPTFKECLKLIPDLHAQCLPLQYHMTVAIFQLMSLSFSDWHLALCVFPQSCHQQGPLLWDAGSEEEEGVIHEEALELFSTPNIALERAQGSGVYAHPVWASAEAMVEVCLRLLLGISLGRN